VHELKVTNNDFKWPDLAFDNLY